jgi:hypothetical protein
VPGVVAALKAHDDVCPFRQPIDDLAFTLVAPLGADHHDVGHLDNSERRSYPGVLVVDPPGTAPAPAIGAQSSKIPS